MKQFDGIDHIENRRVLLIDDTKSIHEDFNKILGNSEKNDTLDDLENSLFDDEAETNVSVGMVRVGFEIDSAYQGQEALELVKKSLTENRPYAMVFCDIRMPPGWDGIETLFHIWEVDPNLQAVICTAFSDYSWDDITDKLGNPDRLLILKKPFESIEVLQAANALVSKWNLAEQVYMKMDVLEKIVLTRTEKIRGQKKTLQIQLDELKETRLQLVQSEKMASIGQLAAGVAHEINNPIGFIASNIGTLKEYFIDIKRVMGSQADLVKLGLQQNNTDIGLKSKAASDLYNELDINFTLEDINDLINDSLDGTQRVKRIVSDLSEFSHVNEPNVVTENINELLEKTISVASNTLKYKAEVIREFSDIPPINCFGGKLAQIFLNLVINAAHAIEDQGKIILRTGMVEPLRDKVWIEVSDTGSGIEEDHMDKIFDPFFTTKEVGKGTGLGLHMVRSIIDNHKGKICVESTIGMGTTFHIELPIDGNLDKDDREHEGELEDVT